MKIILASGSPRRQQILSQAGIPYEVIVSNVDETAEGTSEQQVKEISQRKAFAVKPNATQQQIILAADTLVCIDNKVLGKPKDKNDAFKMLSLLSGKAHTVHTGVTLLRGNEQIVFSDSTQVFFHKLTDAQIWAYIATGEPMDKAGAYGAQEKGALLIEKIEGDFYTVVGLQISKVCRELEKMGFNVWGVSPC